MLISRNVLPIPLVLLIESYGTTALEFSTDSVGTNGFQDDPLVFIDRVYVPYGPDLVSTPMQTDQPWTGYAYGMGATEHWAYDHKEKYIYSQSEAGGYITIIDWSTLPGKVTPYSMDVCGENCDVRDIVVCPEQGLLFMTRTDRNDVLVYDTVKRSSPATPTLVEEIQAGNAPDAMRLSNDCKILAVANINEGTDMINLGSVTLVTNFWPTDSADTITQSVSLATFNEAYLLDREVHLPLTKNSAIYWNSVADDGTTYGWEEEGGVIEKFNPAIVLSPEFLVFNEDGTELFINLQHNSALVRVDTATGEAVSIDGYGLKSFGSSSNGVDVVKDGECNLVKNDCLYLARNPDAIATVLYDGVDYILTADEGSDFEFGDFEEKRDSTELFGEGATFLYANFTFDDSFFVPGDSTAGCTANFQADCESNLEAWLVDWCSDMEISIGSSAVDFSTGAPIMNKIVGFGGRGIGIYKLASDPKERMVQVFDSASQFEEETCAKYEWAQNSVMDEEFAPACDEENVVEESCPAWVLADDDFRSDITDMNDPEEDGCESTGGACPMGETVDEKAQEDGLGVESVVVGIACGRLVTLACGENNSMCFLYDITDIANPALIKTFHLSEVSKTKNPAQSYRKDLGDIDAESVLWIPPSRSPNGRSGFLFGGAISGTLSFYEFQCLEAEDKCFPDGCADATEAEKNSSSSSTKSLSAEVIAFIVVGSVAVVALAAFVLSRSLKRSSSGVVSDEKDGKGDFA